MAALRGSTVVYHTIQNDTYVTMLVQPSFSHYLQCRSAFVICQIKKLTLCLWDQTLLGSQKNVQFLCKTVLTFLVISFCLHRMIYITN